MQVQTSTQMDFSNILTNTNTLILLIILVVSFILLSLHYGLIYLRVGRYKNAQTPLSDTIADAKLPSVSVVLTAHNQAVYLKESLVLLLEQDYPNYEVVVVDYTSRDDTQFVLKVCSENYKNLKVISFKEDVNMFSGKKYPLSIGIKSAKNDIILLTEPDCAPKTFTWIRSMVMGYMHGADIVIGYCGVKQEVGLLNGMMQYDNLCAAASCLGYAMMGNPYTATGRNLSYRRNFFFDRGAFIRHYSEPEGADDMFVNQNANRRNTALMLAPESFVSTDPKPTYRQWRLQRKNVYATKKYYQWDLKLMLSLHPLAVLLFYLSIVLLLVLHTFPWEILAGVVALSWIWQIVCFSQLSKRFEVKMVHFFSPFYELYFLFANTILYTTTLHKKIKRWK